jgi:hypothetical protein
MVPVDIPVTHNLALEKSEGKWKILSVVQRIDN